MKSQFISIFGQIEQVVAESMVEEQKVRMVPLTQFPEERMCPGVWVNEHGHRAKFAIQINNTAAKAEFERRVADLRA